MNDANAFQFKNGLSDISWEERLRDHENKIEEYLQNRLFNGCNPDTTIKGMKSAITSLFRRVEIDDLAHPEGRRQLLVWDLLEPRLGSGRLSLIIGSLMKDHLAPGTRRRYLNDLKYFCEYVMAKPGIPGASGVTLEDKYGSLAMTFTKYDLPIHAADRPQRSRYALTPDLRNDFYEFLRTDYLSGHPLPHVGVRNYTAVVLQTEIGARVSELLGIRSQAESCDIDEARGRVRIFGKAKAYSGKRIRWVPLTELSAEVLRTFQSTFRPMFPRSGSDYLFLSEDGASLPAFQFFRAFRKMVQMARTYGLPIPEDLRPHDLRRTFATIALESNPLGYRKLLKHLGHSYPSSIAPYIVATDDDLEEQQTDLMDIFLDPHIYKRRTA